MKGRQIRPHIPTGLALLTLILGLAAGAPALAMEADAWDQERAKQLATQFDQAVAALAESARVQNLDFITANGPVDYLVVEDLQSLSRMSGRLKRHLDEGKGKADTQPLFERLMVIVRSLRDLRPQTTLLAESQADIEKAREILGQLASLYGQTLPPPVAAPGKE